MSLEFLNAASLEAFLLSEKAFLILGKPDCQACHAWTETLRLAIERGEVPDDFRYGKLLLTERGLISFKKASPWLADLDVLPYNAIYLAGKLTKKYPGGGLDRLKERLASLRV